MEMKKLNHFREILPDCAKGLIYYWLEYSRLRNVTEDDTLLKRSFVVTYEDLKKLRETKDYHGLRIYFGLKTVNESASMEMILVPVREVMENGQKRLMDIEDAKIYRCTLPCPGAGKCVDQESVYFNGEEPKDELDPFKCFKINEN